MSNSRSLKGLNADLENFELTDVMQLITQQVKCGILSVEGSDGNCSWSFNEGNLVDFNCHFPGHTLDLKTILIKGGYLDEHRFLSLLEEHASSPAHSLQNALVKDGIISREEFERINLRRVIESFIITLQWTKGKYSFIPTSEIKSLAFFLPQDTNFIILEAMRQIDEMSVMKKRLVPLERIYETTLTLDGYESSKEDVSLFQEGLEKQFDKDEFEVYKLFDGNRSLIEVLNLSIIGQFNTYRIILDFLDQNIITLQTEGPSGKHFSHPLPSNGWLTGLALLIFSSALIISVFISSWHHERPGEEKNPTFFTAIIDNLRADQQKDREQARELLR